MGSLEKTDWTYWSCRNGDDAEISPSQKVANMVAASLGRAEAGLRDHISDMDGRQPFAAHSLCWLRGDKPADQVTRERGPVSGSAHHLRNGACGAAFSVS